MGLGFEWDGLSKRNQLNQIWFGVQKGGIDKFWSEDIVLEDLYFTCRAIRFFLVRCVVKYHI